MVMAMKAYVVKDLILEDLGSCFRVVFTDTEDGKLKDKAYLKLFYKEFKVEKNILMLFGSDGLAHRVFVVEDPARIRIIT